jgi:FkbM family methyltransferase
MIIDLTKIIKDYNIALQGVIHVGGYNGEEIYEYKNLGIKDMVFFEPQKDLYNQILNKKAGDDNIKAFNFGLGSEKTKLKMYRSFGNDGASSSFLKPEKHLSLYPGIIFEQTEEEFEVYRMDDVVENKSQYNFLNMDVQGFELEVLKGGYETLKHIEIIICEVNRDEVYEHNAHIDDISKFLKGFKCVEINWLGELWGDACYIRDRN